MKPLIESNELKIMRSLHMRGGLSSKETLYYFNKEEGFEGEKQFSIFLQKRLTTPYLMLHDLLFEQNNTVFQLDHLLIQPSTLYYFEIKHLEGDYYIDKNEWYSCKTNQTIQNPLLQIQRSEPLLKKVIQESGHKIPVETYVVFNNPEFTLYNAPRNPSIIFPSQLNRLITKLNQDSGTLFNKHTKLAEYLISKNLVTSPNAKIPKYEYRQLKKGIPCFRDDAFMDVRGNDLICGDCGCKESLDSGILRAVEEFHLLFPDKKITTNIIQEWCGGNLSKKTIRRVLGRNYQQLGHGKYTYYVKK